MLTCCQILAYEGQEAVPFQKKWRAGLQTQLTRCDICVREYHRSRVLLETILGETYEPDEVHAFMRKYDRINIDRINAGLDVATESLTDLPPDKRSITACGDVGMYALFEALNCVPYLQDEDAIQDHFDRPWRLVHTKKKVKLPSYVPGMVAFLFSHNSDRSSWAYRNFNGIKRPMTATEFEFSVKPVLERAMGRVNIGMLDVDFLARFWKGTHALLTKLTEDLVMDHLRTLESNLYTLGLEHFQVDAGHFADLVASYIVLLQLAPSAFWDAMGGISCQAVGETIFRSPVLDRALEVAADDDRESLNLKDMMAWIKPYLNSIKIENMIPPIRLVLEQLLHGYQREEYSRHARNVTWDLGLVCLLETIERMSRSKGGPVMIHLIEVVAEKHVQVIMQELEGIEKKAEIQIDKTEQLSLDIVEHILSLDVQSLALDRQEIGKTKTLNHEIGLSGLHIWKMTMRAIKPGHPALATSVISGIKGLLQLESFPRKQVEASPKYAQAWNQALQRAVNYIQNDLLERLESFTPDQLVELYQEQKATQGMMSLLFSGEQRIHQAALNVLKIMSLEDNRRDSLFHLVKAFFGTTLSAVADAQSTVAISDLFGPCPTLLKLSADLMSCLCDSRDGVLRSKPFETEADVTALEKFWQHTWRALETIFARTEHWSAQGYDKQMLQEFCRDTMDFADSAFDQYSIFASTIQGAARRFGREDSKMEVGKHLLRFPTRAFSVISKWLRLRDDYLVAKAVSLTSKILLRLRDVGVEVDSHTAQFIEDVATSTERHAKVKTKLTMSQKAELQRALEEHMGAELESVSDVAVDLVAKKQGTLAEWASSGTGRSMPTGGAKSKPGVIDVDAWSAANDKHRRNREESDDFGSAYNDIIKGATSVQDNYRQRMPAKKPIIQATARTAQKNQAESRNFLQKRKAEQEALRKQKDSALAKAKGLGAGSGVAGLGDVGKDYSTEGQNVMVSSDDGESDDDDDLDMDLFGISKAGKTKIVRPQFDAAGGIGLKPEVKKVPMRIQRTQRSSKDMRARLAPDLQPLHRSILNWDFFHDGDYPPGANEHLFREVRNSYNDPTSYQETFQPLLTLEAWQNMVKSREENSARPYEIKITNRTNVDIFVEFSSIIGHVEMRDVALQEGDIILLSKARKPADDASAPHCLARVYRVKRQKAHCEVVYQASPQTSLASGLVTQAMVYGLKIQSITPLEREYGALQGLQYYDLCQQIIKAAPSKRLNFSEKQIAAYQDVWNVNRAQSEAINAALENEGFSLIQGPPGSGKTKTIIAIVGGMLSQSLSSTANAETRISMPKANGASTAVADGSSKKLLVCAPSNAAVDELVMRLKEGVKTRNGRHHRLNLVRIGRSEAINSQVRDVTMDELVAKRLGKSDNGDLKQQNAELFKEHSKVSSVLRDLYQRRDGGEVKGKELTHLEDEIVSVRKRKNELGVRIDSAKDHERNAGREAELNRKRAQQAVLDEAHVICATLSGSGHDMFQSLNIEFETVIIDEAAQCVEMSSLIPLKYGCVKCVLVGDPKQLPPTVFSKEAARFQYEQSLFVRMQNNFADEVHLLDTQYRMHPDISVFPSRTFYDGLLKDGEGMAALRRRPWHSSGLLAPFRFFDVKGQHQSAPKGHSLINLAEINVAISLFERLTTDFNDYDYTGRIGIITPYKSQLKALKELFSSRFGNSILDTVEFNTTDAFQGRESEIIIFSCVRASPAGGIGFLQDIRRMNVGLTRAKSSLWVLGNSDSLVRGPFWKKLVEDAQARERYTTGDLLSMLKQPSSAYPVDAFESHSMLDVGSHSSHMSGTIQSNWTSDSGRPSMGANSTARPSNDLPPDLLHATIKQNSERMEGISYRLEDRVAHNRKLPPSEIGSERSSLQPPDEPSEDVEMDDAGIDVDATSVTTPHDFAEPTSRYVGLDKRAETPLSGDDIGAARANGSVKPKVAPVSSVAQPVFKKRPAPSPFMPVKKNKPRP